MCSFVCCFSCSAVAQCNTQQWPTSACQHAHNIPRGRRRRIVCAASLMPCCSFVSCCSCAVAHAGTHTISRVAIDRRLVLQRGNCCLDCSFVCCCSRKAVARLLMPTGAMAHASTRAISRVAVEGGSCVQRVSFFGCSFVCWCSRTADARWLCQHAHAATRGRQKALVCAARLLLDC
jgi:hypothetical protein